MNLFEKVENFEKLVENVVAAPLALATKFETELNKLAQQKLEADVASEAKDRLLKEISSHLQQNPNLNAGQATETLWSTDKTLYLQDLVNVLQNVAGALMNGSKANKEFASRTILPNIDSLKKTMSERPSIPSPYDTAPQEQSVPAQKTQKSNYPYIPRAVQNKLNQLVGASLVLDGSLGPETTKALNLFKQKYNVPANTSPADLYKLISTTNG